MIESVTIKNFQSHKETTLNFSEGLNVIKGPSHKGKSAVVRAIRWALENKPRGEEFKSHFADKKDPVSVSILFTEDIRITRYRGETNGYDIEYQNGEIKTLKALNTGVPQEILDITNMTNLNLQSQSDDYFMLKEKPGNRAKELNKIVGLDIIDETTKKINSALSVQTSRSKSTDEDITETEKKLSKFSGITQLKKRSDEIESFYLSLNKTKTEASKLGSICDKVKELNNDKEEFSAWLFLEEDALKMEKTMNTVDKAKRKRKTILQIIENIKINNDKIIKTKEILKSVVRIEKIEELQEKRKVQRDKLSLLKIIWNSINVSNKIKSEKETLLDDAVKQLSKIDTCPLCGTTDVSWESI